MFLGHFGVGFALKRALPQTPLGVLMAAPLLLDLVWPVFLLVGLERVRIDPGNTVVTPLAFEHYPYSHSLVMAVVWGMAMAALFVATRRGGSAGRPIVFAQWMVVAVTSHWALDWLVHKPDLPMTPWGEARFGLGWWNSLPLTLLAEAAIFAGGLWLYTRTTRARSRAGWLRLALFAGVLVAIYLGNLAGPPPPDQRSLAIVATAMWLLTVWAARVDKARDVTIARQAR